MEVQELGRGRTFQGQVIVRRGQGALKVAKAWEDRTRSVWADGSLLENGKVGRWEETHTPPEWAEQSGKRCRLGLVNAGGKKLPSRHQQRGPRRRGPRDPPGPEDPQRKTRVWYSLQSSSTPRWPWTG